MHTNNTARIISGKTISPGEQTSLEIKVDTLDTLDIDKAEQLERLSIFGVTSDFSALTIKQAKRLALVDIKNTEHAGCAFYLSHQNYPAGLKLYGNFAFISLEWFIDAQRYTLEIDAPEHLLWSEVWFLTAAQAEQLPPSTWEALTHTSLIVIQGDSSGQTLNVTTDAQLLICYNHTLDSINTVKSNHVRLYQLKRLTTFSFTKQYDDHTPAQPALQPCIDVQHCDKLQHILIKGNTQLVRVGHVGTEHLTVAGPCHTLQLNQCKTHVLAVQHAQNLFITDCQHLSAIDSDFQPKLFLSGLVNFNLQHDYKFKLNEASISSLLADINPQNADTIAWLLNTLTLHFTPAECRFALRLLRQLQLKQVNAEALWQARATLNTFNRKGRMQPSTIKPNNSWLWRLAPDLEYEALCDDFAFVLTAYQQQFSPAKSVYPALINSVATNALSCLSATKLFQQQRGLLSDENWQIFWQDVLKVRSKKGTDYRGEGNKFSFAQSCEQMLYLLSNNCVQQISSSLADTFVELIFLTGNLADFVEQKAKVAALLQDKLGFGNTHYRDCMSRLANNEHYINRHSALAPDALRLFLQQLANWHARVPFTKRNINDFCRLFNKPFVIHHPSPADIFGTEEIPENL